MSDMRLEKNWMNTPTAKTINWQIDMECERSNNWIKYTSSNTCRRNSNRNRFLPKFRRILCVTCDTLWSCPCEYHCRMGHLLSFCSCTTCSIRFMIRWKSRVCILLCWRCMNRRSWGLFDSNRMNTMSTPFRPASKCCMGTNLILVHELPETNGNDAGLYLPSM